MTGCLIFDKIMNEFCSFTELNEEKEETFVKDVDEILNSLIDSAIDDINKPVSLMVKEDNLKVVEFVDEKGGFMIKDTIDLLAHKLNISRYTIYNYLDEIKNKRRVNK